jgi:hypothetical protein
VEICEFVKKGTAAPSKATPFLCKKNLKKFKLPTLQSWRHDLCCKKNLKKFKLPTLQSWRHDLCEKLFEKLIYDQSHKLYELLPQRHQPKYNLRKYPFNIPLFDTKRYQNTFIPSIIYDNNL